MLFLTIFVIATLISSLWCRLRGKSVRRTLVMAVAVSIGVEACMAALIWGGPLSSGALLLLRPAPPGTHSHDLSPSYRPLHKGYVDLATGLYIREDEDFVLSGSPSFVWRRAYLSRDRVARQMGIGTTHNAEWYLIGDLNALQHVELIREDGSRVVFDRTSQGNSYLNAMFVHTASDTEFYGARVGWVGTRWAMRLQDGTLAIFQDCGPDPDRACSLVSLRDSRGRVIRFNRDARGILRSIDAGTQRLTFEYDSHRRIVRAVQGTHEASYTYDGLGRLVRAVVDGTDRSFSYGPRDEMTAVREPERSLENTFDANSRLTRQVVHWPGRPDSVESFAYLVDGRNVLETTVTTGEGERSTYRWNGSHQRDVEIHEVEGHSPVIVQFDRGNGTFVRSITIFCRKDGRPVSDTAEMTSGDEDIAEADLIERVCN
jgi:YD repeat-containing protein